MITPPVRARVERDGPGEWSWALHDNGSILVTDTAPSWRSAFDAADVELRLLAEADQPPAFEIPIAPADADQLRRICVELERRSQPVVGYCDGYCDGSCDAPTARPLLNWRRWLGLGLR